MFSMTCEFGVRFHECYAVVGQLQFLGSLECRLSTFIKTGQKHILLAVPGESVCVPGLHAVGGCTDRNRYHPVVPVEQRGGRWSESVAQ